LYDGNDIRAAGVSRSNAMFILTIHRDLRLLWVVLPIPAKFYILFLFAAAVYSSYSLTRIAFRFRQLLKHAASTDARDVGLRLTQMTRGIETLRQFHTLLFLLFGVCLPNSVSATLRAIQYSSMSLSGARIDVFETVAAFVFFVFVVFIFLHVFQWTVAARLQAAFAANVNNLR
jgi:hypothetical protein